MIHKNELMRIRSVMIENRKDYESELKEMPEGELYCLRNRDAQLYYQRFPKRGNRKKEKRVGITKDSDKVFSLVRKEYLIKAIAIIDRDIRTIDMAIKHYVNYDEESVMAKFLEKHPELSEGVYHGKQSDAEWADSYVRQENFYDESRKHTSAKGEKMRSKNEIYISSRLDHYEIPYRYEASIAHPDVDRIPDFTIRRPRDGKIIYWEHLGVTDSEDYLLGNGIKFREYRDIGIVPWDNLIVTYDDADGNIDAKIIEAMIEGWLL